jgi:putative transcriptional regulator
MHIVISNLSRALAAGAVAALLVGATPGPGEHAGSGSLAGQLLVAAPDMSDPRFAEAVILLVKHDASGALGIVINRPVEERPIASLLKELGEADAGSTGTVRIFAGGPVDTEVGFVVHGTDYHRAETVDIDGRVAVTSSPEILKDIGHGAGPAKALIAFGYAGWGPGQLESELAEHAWFTEAEDPKLIFDEDRDTVWKEALARRSRDL